jgi:hypothetical protein
MRKRRAYTLGLVVAGMLAWTTPGWTGDGRTLLKECTAVLRTLDSQKMGDELHVGRCSGYVHGFHVGYIVGRGGPDGTAGTATGLICFPSPPRPADHMIRILVDWLQRHPTLLHEDQSVVTTRAFMDAFPCPPAEVGPQKTPSGKPRK